MLRSEPPVTWMPQAFAARLSIATLCSIRLSWEASTWMPSWSAAVVTFLRIVFALLPARSQMPAS